MAINFPDRVKPTPCKTKTQTVNIPTVHGNVRKEVKITVVKPSKSK